MVGEKLLIYRTTRLAKKKSSRKCSMSYRDAKNIGIIFTTGDLDKHLQVKDFIKKLQYDGKEVEVLTFLPKGEENHEFIFNFFTEKDISFFGKFTNRDVIRFAARQFDFLFYIDCNHNPLIESLMAITKAKCRVGCYTAGKDHFFELMIQPKRMTTENLLEEFFRYIKILH
jgi:5-methylcytosine-specific restriction endonuclease McrBC regulatory subunit McrC